MPSQQSSQSVGEESLAYHLAYTAAQQEQHVIGSPDMWLLFEEEKLPEEVKRSSWGFVARENALTYLTSSDLHIAYLQFKAYRALRMITTPKQTKHVVAAELLNLQRFFESRIARSSYGFWSLLLRTRFVSATVGGEDRKGLGIFRWRRD